MLDILKEIPEFSNWIKIEPVLKGWSDDQKFYIEDNLGNKLLLRLANISKYQTKKIEYEYLNKLLTLEISMTTPIKFGICCQYVYTLYKWIEGVDAEIGLKEYSKKEQYEFGIIAGKILKRIHSIPASENQEDWAIRFKRKISKKLDSYEKCAIKIPNDTFFIKFILDNLSCLDNRPQTFQHGDY
ncbi:MAG: hypothetical protein K0Q49_2425, partial [Haloplasmataceae bacterium]|nr:hypothetical protein [Haloplasmataceae bacterium]